MSASGGNGSVILSQRKQRFREPLGLPGITPRWKLARGTGGLRVSVWRSMCRGTARRSPRRRGKFNDDLGLREYSVSFSANQPLQYNYRWHDLNGDGNYQPGEVNLDLNGPDYLSVNPGPGFGAVGAGNNIVNPDLKLPHTNEGSASLERELGQGLSVRGLFVYKKLYDAITNVNILRPLSVYDQVFTRKDPGPDGLLNTTDDGLPFTIYDYNPAYRGNAFVQSTNLNRPADRNDSFKNFEVMLTKRPIGKWFANTAILATKNRRYLTGVVQSPNDLINALDTTWEVSYRLAGGYTRRTG